MSVDDLKALAAVLHNVKNIRNCLCQIVKIAVKKRAPSADFGQYTPPTE